MQQQAWVGRARGSKKELLPAALSSPGLLWPIRYSFRHHIDVDRSRLFRRAPLEPPRDVSFPIRNSDQIRIMLVWSSRSPCRVRILVCPALPTIYMTAGQALSAPYPSTACKKRGPRPKPSSQSIHLSTMSFFNLRLFASMAMADVLRFPVEDLHLHDHAPKEATAELPLPVGSSRQEPHRVVDCSEAGAPPALLSELWSNACVICSCVSLRISST